MRSIADIFRSAAVLDENGRHVNGSDKMSNHNYGDAYERIIGDTFGNTFDHHGRQVAPRKVVKLFMEVGVADGSCLRAWNEIFPWATIVGMDIHPSDKAHGPRIEFHLGDQRSREDCERAAAGRLFDVIVEDATHSLPNTLLTLLYLWPSVRPGGIYIVEEWDNVGALRKNIAALWPNAAIVDTDGPFGGIESLVVLKKPL